MGSTQHQLVCTSACVTAPSTLPALDNSNWPGRAGGSIEITPTALLDGHSGASGGGCGDEWSSNNNNNNAVRQSFSHLFGSLQQLHHPEKQRRQQQQQQQQLQQQQRQSPGDSLVELIWEEAASYVPFGNLPKDHTGCLQDLQGQHQRRHDSNASSCRIVQLSGKENQRPGRGSGHVSAIVAAAGDVASACAVVTPDCAGGSVTTKAHVARIVGAQPLQQRQQQQQHQQQQQQQQQQDQQQRSSVSSEQTQLPLLTGLSSLEVQSNPHEADDSEPEEITSDLHDRQGPQAISTYRADLQLQSKTALQTASTLHIANGLTQLPSCGKESVFRETCKSSSGGYLVNDSTSVLIAASGVSSLNQPLDLFNDTSQLRRLPTLKQEADGGDPSDEKTVLSGFLSSAPNFQPGPGLSTHPVNSFLNSAELNTNGQAVVSFSLSSSASSTTPSLTTTTSFIASRSLSSPLGRSFLGPRINQSLGNGLQPTQFFAPSAAVSPQYLTSAHSPLPQHSQAPVIMDPQHLYQLQAAQQVAAAQQLVSLGQAAAAAHGGQPPPVSGLQLLNYANQNNSNNNSTNNGSSEHNLAVALGVSGYAGVGGVAATQNTGNGSADKSWPCPSCKIPFASAIELQAHLTTHTQKPGQVEGRNIPCEVCGKLFATQDRMKAHMRSAHQADKNCSCSICGSGGVCPQSAGFSYRCKLLDHMRTHSGDRPFHCDVCGRGFSQKNHLTRHTMIHTGERPFSCEFCGRGFYRKDKLTRHRRTHTGWPPGEAPKATNGEQVGMALALMNQSVQPSSGGAGGQQGGGGGGAGGQQGGGGGGGGRGGRRATINPVTCHCEICGRGFTERAHLARHHMIHTGETPFICPVCQKGFYRKDKLNGHMRTHTGEKPFVCYADPNCGMGFHKKEKLADHMLTVHMGAALPAVTGAGGASQPRKPRKPSHPQPSHAQGAAQGVGVGGGGAGGFGAATGTGTASTAPTTTAAGAAAGAATTDGAGGERGGQGGQSGGGNGGGGGVDGGGGGNGNNNNGSSSANGGQGGPPGLPLQYSCLKCGQAFSALKWLQKHKCSYAAAAAAALLQAGAHSFLYASQAPADVA